MLQLRPSGASGDVSIGTMPSLMATGFPLLSVRANLVYPIATSRDFAILPTAGVSGVGAVGGAVGGWNAGISALLVTAATGVRAGVTSHFFSTADSPVWLLEIGFVDLPQGYWFVPRRRLR